MVGCVEILYDDERVGVFAGCLDDVFWIMGGLTSLAFHYYTSCCACLFAMAARIPLNKIRVLSCCLLLLLFHVTISTCYHTNTHYHVTPFITASFHITSYIPDLTVFNAMPETTNAHTSFA